MIWRAELRLTLILVALLASATHPQTGDGYDLTWSTIDGGGGMVSSGGSFTLAGTIGQPDARTEPMSGGAYRLTGGFWVSPSCVALDPDIDDDCDVDQADYQLFEACASGPAILYAAGCGDRDFDGDNDVDQSDFGIFQRCFSGQDAVADPSCIE